MSQDAAVKPSTSPNATLIHGRRERTAIAAAPGADARWAAAAQHAGSPSHTRPSSAFAPPAPAAARRLGADTGWRSERRGRLDCRGLQLPAGLSLGSGPGLRARVGSETSPGGDGGGGGGSERSCRRRRSSGGGNASAPRLPPCHWRAWALPPLFFPSPRPRSRLPLPPPRGSELARRRSRRRHRCQPEGSAGRGISPSPALGRPPCAPQSRAGLLSGRKRSLSGRLRLAALTPPLPSSPSSCSSSHFPSRPAPPLASRHSCLGALLASSRRLGSADLIGGARVREPPLSSLLSLRALLPRPTAGTSWRDPSHSAPPQVCQGATLRVFRPFHVVLTAAPLRLLSLLGHLSGNPTSHPSTSPPSLTSLLPASSTSSPQSITEVPLSFGVSPKRISEVLEILTPKG